MFGIILNELLTRAYVNESIILHINRMKLKKQHEN